MRNERKEKLVFNFVSSSAGIVSAASYSHKVLFSIDIVHRFIKESPSPSPSREGWARLFFLLFLVGADEGDFGVVGRELVLHRGALGETGTDALDVGVAELHGGAGGVALDGGTEAAEEPHTHGVAILQVSDDLLLQGGDDGTDVVDGDGTLLGNLLSDLFEFDDTDGACHSVEHSSTGPKVFTFTKFVLHLFKNFKMWALRLIWII